MADFPSLLLSALDVAPVWANSSATVALRNTIDLAKRVEALGYARFWIAEHHTTPSLATAVPAVLTGVVASATTSIRVGSGGVLLPNHSPLVVAEQFGTLEALFPGRIDLGLGRGVGSRNPLTPGLLGRKPEDDSADDFRDRIAELASYFAAESGLPASPVPTGAAGENQPPIVLLGSSLASARLAGALGLPYAYAHHIKPTETAEAMAAYRESFRPSSRIQRPYAVVATLVFAADTDAEARDLAEPYLVGRVMMQWGSSDMLFPTPAQAVDFPYTPAQREWVRTRLEGQLLGGPERVRSQLIDMRRTTGADELMALTIVHDHERRIRSYEVLAEVVGT